MRYQVLPGYRSPGTIPPFLLRHYCSALYRFSMSLLEFKIGDRRKPKAIHATSARDAEQIQ
jgi:hypothetical protein